MQALRTSSISPRCLRSSLRCPAQPIRARAIAQGHPDRLTLSKQDQKSSSDGRKKAASEIPVLKNTLLRRGDLHGPLPAYIDVPVETTTSPPTARAAPAGHPKLASRRLHKRRRHVVQSEIFDELFSTEALRRFDNSTAVPPKAKRHVPRVPLDFDTAAPHRNLAASDIDRWLDSKGDDVDKESLRAALEMHPEKQGREVKWGKEPNKDVEHSLEFGSQPKPHMSVDQTLGNLRPLEETGADELMSSNVEVGWESANESDEGQIRSGFEHSASVGQEENHCGLLVLHGASTLLTEADFRHLVRNTNGKHIEKWQSKSPLLRVIRGRNKWTLARNGDYYIIFDSEHSAQKYYEDAQMIHGLANLRFRRNLDKLIPSVPSSKYDSSTPESLLDGYALSAPLAKLNLELKKAPWPPLIRSVVEHGGYEELTKGRESEHEVLLSVEGMLLRQSQILACITNEASRHRHCPRGFLDPVRVRSFELNSPYAAKAASVDQRTSTKQWNKRKDAAYQRRRFIIPFESGDEAERFVMAWHRRDIGDLLDGFDGKSVTVNAELIW